MRPTTTSERNDANQFSKRKTRHQMTSNLYTQNQHEETEQTWSMLFLLTTLTAQLLKLMGQTPSLDLHAVRPGTLR